MKYLIYLRVSSEKQEIETQNRICLEYIKKKENTKDFEYEIFSDPDTSSGKSMCKRLGLQQLLNTMQKGQTVLVYKLDRLSRDVIEMITIYRKIKDKGIDIIAINDPYTDEFTVGLMGLVAQKERDNIRKRTKDSIQTKKQKGERYSLHAPYGFKFHDSKKIAIKVGSEYVLKTGVLVEDTEEQNIINVMRDLHVMGNSYHEISMMLKSQGYMSRAGKVFPKMSIYRILKRTALATSEDQLQAV